MLGLRNVVILSLSSHRIMSLSLRLLLLDLLQGPGIILRGEHGVGDLLKQTLGNFLAIQIFLVERLDLLGAWLLWVLTLTATIAEVVDVLALLVLSVNTLVKRQILWTPLALIEGLLLLLVWLSFLLFFLELVSLVWLHGILWCLLSLGELADWESLWRLGLVHENTVAFLTG